MKEERKEGRKKRRKNERRKDGRKEKEGMKEKGHAVKPCTVHSYQTFREIRRVPFQTQYASYKNHSQTKKR
jgi:hypothetical protein